MFFSSRRRHTRCSRDWSSDVCSSDLREHDVLERYESTQLRGLLAHLREIDSSEVEKKFKEFIGRPEFLKLKCLLLPIRPERDFEGDILETVRKELQEMREGEVRTL